MQLFRPISTSVFLLSIFAFLLTYAVISGIFKSFHVQFKKTPTVKVSTDLETHIYLATKKLQVVYNTLLQGKFGNSQKFSFDFS